jgi:hypothetical protein
MRTRRGAHGHGSTFFVRWSFTAPALSGRQEAVNHSPVEYVYTGKRDENAEGNCVRGEVTEEVTTKEALKDSLQKDASRRRPPTVIRLSTSKHLRYCLATIRAEVEALPDIGKAVKKLVIDSTAAILHREHRAGRLQPGRRLGAFIDEFCDCVSGLPGEDLWDTVLSVDERLRSGEADVEEVHDLRWRCLAWSYWQIPEAQRFAARVCA